MFDSSMTSLSLGWFLLAAGIISALVIATDKTSHTSDVPLQAGKLSSHTQDLKPVTRWPLVVLTILLASFGALLIQEDHNWLPFQKPHFLYIGDQHQSSFGQDLQALATQQWRARSYHPLFHRY